MKISPAVIKSRLLECLCYENRYDRIVAELNEYFQSTSAITDSVDNLLNTFKLNEKSIRNVQLYQENRKNTAFSVYSKAINDQMEQHGAEPFIITRPFVNTKSIIIKITDEKGRHIGQVSVAVGSRYRITDEDKEVMHIAAQVASLAMRLTEVDSEIIDSRVQWNEVLNGLLSGTFENREQLLRKLQTQTKLCKYERYRLVLATKASGGIANSRFISIYNSICSLGDQCLAVVNEPGYVAALFNDEKEYGLFDHGGKLEDIANYEFLYMVVSDPLYEIWDVPVAYRQCKNTLRSLMRRHPIGRYACRDDCRLDELISSVNSESGSLKEYISSSVFAILKYDEENDTQYFATLRELMKNNCNISRAAQAMFIHKTTMSYRVEKMKELFHLDFDDYEKRLRLQVSIYIVENFL